MALAISGRLAATLRFAAVLLSMGGALSAGAAEPATTPAPASAASATYAVVSLIGDQFSVVSRRDQVASRLDGNDRRSFPVADATFDGAAMAAAERATTLARPGTEVLRASIRDPRLFALQDKLLVDDAESHGMRQALHDVLVKSGATRLLLVTKHRDEASFKVQSGSIGAGVISGIGFYIDSQTSMHRVDQRDGSRGFLAPFAFVTVSLIDLATMQTLKSKNTLESSMSLAVEKEGADRAWDALSAAAKVDALDRVIRRAVDVGTAAVLAD